MREKLTFGEKFGYSLGDLAANFIFQAMLALQLDFYTHTFGLSAAQAGAVDNQAARPAGAASARAAKVRTERMRDMGATR